MRRHRETLPIDPLAAWIEEREQTVDHGDLARHLGVNPRTLWRWKNRRDGNGDPTDVVIRQYVEDALHRAGYAPWDVWPELAEEVVEIRRGWCSRCEEVVSADADHRCLWCGGPIAREMSKAERIVRAHTICPSCRGEKARGALRCRPCSVAARPRHRDGTFPPGDPAATVCACGGPKSHGAVRCWSCFVAKGGQTGAARPDSRRPEKMSEEQLQLARDLYDGGLSVRKVAAILHPNTGYSSEASCAQAIFDLFKTRGWKLRDRAAAVAQENRERVADLPFCDFVKADGSRCQRRTSKGRCWHHREENLAPRLAELHARDSR